MKTQQHELRRCGFVWNRPFMQNDYMTWDDVMNELEGV